MARPHIALIGGQGWPLTETLAGLPTFARRLAEMGVEVQTFAHTARQAIRNFLDEAADWHSVSGHPWPPGSFWRGLIGDSLGAGAAALYAGDVKGPVAFVGGFQPSAWDPIGQGPLTDRTIRVANNVLVAHCIWDPVFVDTAGLGNAHYVAGPTTRLILTEHRGAHPDDWGYAQDVMLEHISRLLQINVGRTPSNKYPSNPGKYPSNPGKS
jgi:hypothetical protein